MKSKFLDDILPAIIGGVFPILVLICVVMISTREPFNKSTPEYSECSLENDLKVLLKDNIEYTYLNQSSGYYISSDDIELDTIKIDNEVYCCVSYADTLILFYEDYFIQYVKTD